MSTRRSAESTQHSDCHSERSVEPRRGAKRRISVLNTRFAEGSFTGASAAHDSSRLYAPDAAAAEQEADRLLRDQPGVYTARQLRGKARRETPISGVGGDGDHALDAEDWLTLRGLAALRPGQRLDIMYDRLDDRERRAMIRWLDGATQAEIGAALGVSQRHVSTILARAVLKCRDSCVLYEGSPLEGEFWWLVREAEKSIYRPPERVWRHQRTPDRALARSLSDKGQTFLFFVNLP
jgi:DNA-directed RNA polymerase specialized sigma24 family protein